MFEAFFKGQFGVAIVEGAVGYRELAKYTSKHHGQVAMWTQVRACRSQRVRVRVSQCYRVEAGVGWGWARGRSGLCGSGVKRSSRTTPHPSAAPRQVTLDELDIDLDYTTDVKPTNAGGILEIHMHGHTTLVVLRPSLGSAFFHAHSSHGPQAVALLARSVHNQYRCIGRYSVAAGVGLPQYLNPYVLNLYP